MRAIVKVYANLIRKGRKTIEDVPFELREEVLEALEMTSGKS